MGSGRKVELKARSPCDSARSKQVWTHWQQQSV